MERPPARVLEKARTSRTFGPFFYGEPQECRRRPRRTKHPRLLQLLVVTLALSCAPPPPPPEPPPPPTRTLPAIEPGGASPGASVEAARLLEQARTALEADSTERALQLAQQVESRFPGAPGTAEALWIVARAAEAEDAYETAAAAADRFRAVLPGDHALQIPALALHGRVLLEEERWTDAVPIFLSLPESAPDSLRSEALEGIRTSVPRMSFLDLEALAQADRPAGWEALLAPVLAEYALGLHVRDRPEEARDAARRALELETEGPEADLARSVVAGEVDTDRRNAVSLATLLPESGSPSEQQYASLILEGIRARLQSGRGAGGPPVELEVRDDSGSVSGVSGLVAELSGRGAAAIVGPLTNAAVEAAARSRSGPIPILSPTAQNLSERFPAVYSLNDFDSRGPVALAGFALSRGLASTVIVHAATPEHRFEADAFAEEYRRLGGEVRRQLSYPPGSTFFEEPFQAVRELLPDALLLAVPPGDIELVAPQLTYFGIDTLGVRVLATEEWAEPDVVERVEPRHLNGIVVATPRPPGREMPGWESFVEDYEEVHRQTLRSRVPALGYDAFGLLLEALSRGAREPEEIQRALEEVEDFPGATGFLSVEDGRIVRRYHLVRLRDREILPVEMAPEERDPGFPDDEPDARDDPRVQDGEPRLQDDEPDVGGVDPGVRDDDPDVRSDDPEVRDEDPEIRDDGPGTRDDDPEVPGDGPEVPEDDQDRIGDPGGRDDGAPR